MKSRNGYSKGKAFLVGAGPGDPGLLTLRALSILQTADVVLHDDLVTPEILNLIRTVRVEGVGKRCGVKRTSQEAIHQQMIRYAREGLTVARLKGGDPLVFGRAGEEMDALREAGIEFEIVPGVTAAASAAASLKIPLTDRRVASQVTFVSAHHPRERWNQRLGEPPAETLVIHMPGGDYAALARSLHERGVRPDTPCLIISNATRADEQTFATYVGDLPFAPAMPSPKIVIIGHIAAHVSAHAAAQNRARSVSRSERDFDVASSAIQDSGPISKATDHDPRNTRHGTKEPLLV